MSVALEFYRIEGQSGKGIAVNPLPDALLRVQQAQHVTAAHGVGAEVTRPPEDGDIALPETQAQFRAGGARYVLPDDDGVERVAHGRLSVALVL